MKKEQNRPIDFLNRHKKHIRNICLDFINPDDAEKAIEYAEQDARNKAINALCTNCSCKTFGEGCIQEIDTCSYVCVFLEAYDKYQKLLSPTNRLLQTKSEIIVKICEK